MRKFTTRFLLFGFFLILVLSIDSSAQQNPITPIGDAVAVTGQLIRTTPKLADIDKTSVYGEPFKITRDMNGIIIDNSGDVARNKREAKRRIEEEMRDRIAREYNEAIQKSNIETPLRPGQFTNANDVPLITPNVPGTSVGTNISGQTSPGLSPSDNNMAAGPNHVIQIVNNVSGSQFTIYNKAGAVISGPTILASLTGRTGSGDPIVLYDQLADRWFLAEFGPSACCNELIIAVSTTSNPTGTWNVYSYVDASFFPDYPKFSVWHNAYYAYTRDFGPGGSGFLGSSVWAFDRTAMLSGAPTAQMVRQRLTMTNSSAMGSVGLEGMVPSSQNGLFIVPTSATQLSIFEVTPNFGAPSITLGPVTALPVNAWSSIGNIAQQTGGTLNTLSPFMMFKLNYRNNGGTESIVTSQTIGNGALGQIRWYEFRRVAGTWTVFQQGNVPGTDGNSRWMPGISMDGCGNIALMYNVAGTGTPAAHPSIRYTGRNASDPLNTMTLPEATIFTGTTSHSNARWGDYNTTVQDYTAAGAPNNGSFWATAQHSNQQTRIANFTLTGGCAPEPAITAGSATLTAESCVPNNGVIDPGETVTVSFCVSNNGTANTSNLVGTMQVSGGVTPISGPQNYGVVTFGGPSVCRDFTFSNTSGTCGGTITVSIQWQDGATNLGTSTWIFSLGTTVISSSQNFDGVVAPALPAGWVATNVSGPAPLWETSSTGVLLPVPSLPNSLFINNPNVVSDKQIVTPSFTPGSGARVSFANNYFLESGFDGGVLEISINGGAFQDIITAGGSFVTGGYSGTLSTAFSNPIGGRQAWTGSSGGFITTTVNLPAASAGMPTVLKFRMGSDNSVAATGWRIDSYTISQPACCGAPCIITCPPNMTISTGPGATTCGTIVNYPPATTTGLCGPVTYSQNSGTFFPIGITTVTATTASGPSCTFTVTVTDATPPVITCPANINRNNDPGLCSAVVTYTAPTVTDNCNLPGTPIVYSQTASQTPVSGNSISCNSGGFHTANSYWRAYPIPNGTGPVRINSVQFGIELADANGTGTTQPVTVRVWRSNGAFPASGRTLLSSDTYNIPDQTLSLYTATLATPPLLNPGEIMALEVFTPDGRAPVNNRFFIGSNTSAQTGLSYIQAVDCGIPNPTDVATIGFPNMRIILNANAVVAGGPVLVQTAGLPSGSIFPVGVTTNSFRATDASGNQSTCSFTVTVVDNEAPSLTCPANITQNTDANQCYATVVTPAPTFADNCAVTSLTWAITGATTATSPATGINLVGTRQFGLTGTTGQGISTVTYTARDAAGNTRSCSFTVTVRDASIPVITAQPVNRTVCVGSNATFSVTASAGAGNPLTYQWQTWTGPSGSPANTWVDIVGANTTSYTLNAVPFTLNTTDYRVVLTGRCSQVISGFATLYVNQLPMVNLTTSIPPNLLPTQVLTITATVSPTGGTFVWFKNGVVMAGVSGPILANLTVSDIGTYRVVYTDANGCVTTSSNISITGQPSDNLYVYPVPNRGQFVVRFFNQTNELVTLRVFDSKGAEVHRKIVQTTIAYTTINVDLSTNRVLTGGTYVVEMRRSDGSLAGSRKIIVYK